MDFTDFFVGKHKFEDLNIRSKGNFYSFYHAKQHRLIKRFVLAESTEVLHVCTVTLIKKEDEHFTPRIHFSVRYRHLPEKFAKTELSSGEDAIFVKASVDMSECHKNFWDLISFFKSMKELDIPDESFSLMKKDAAQIVNAITKHDKDTVLSVVKLLTSASGVTFSDDDINELLQRKQRLKEFQHCLAQSAPEHHWQDFLEKNKWIFGYGLNYVILRVQGQPYVGGKQIDRKGGQNPDFLGITGGEVRFTVLVEIKAPSTPLLDGKAEIRNGAWSLSKDLTDALAQTQANIDRWNREGSRTDENREALEQVGIYTVKPKGIIVIGSLQQVKNDLHKLQTFERFRRSISDVEIITFDELCDRARFIVEHQT